MAWFTYLKETGLLFGRDRVIGGLDELRQQSFGITHYIWRSQDDGKVRDSHRRADDQIFAWAKPPSIGHPGEEYGCRCWAEPILSLAE